MLADLMNVELKILSYLDLIAPNWPAAGLGGLNVKEERGI